MKKLSALLLLMSLGLIYACNKAESGPSYKYFPAASDGVAAKAGTVSITEKELLNGIEADIYEEEMKIFDIKQNKLKGLLLEKYMASEPEKKNMTNDEFMDKHIAKNIKISDKEIDAFIKERKIPQEQVTPDIKERIKQFIEMEKKKTAVDLWLGKKIGKDGVQVFFQKPRRPTYDVKVGDAPAWGNKDAKVTIVEFSDFQCPFCAKGADLLNELKKKYAGKIQVVFKNFPLPFHNQARDAALAGLCANEQGNDKFWKMHDAMFADQAKLDVAALKETAKKLGVEPTAFNKCMDEKKYAANVDQTYQEGQGVGVKSTPTFFVNGQIVMGAQPIDVFSEIIDEALK
ncbi:MAG: DsbA family protein [Bacteriovoracaceae bacterium]